MEVKYFYFLCGFYSTIELYSITIIVFTEMCIGNSSMNYMIIYIHMISRFFLLSKNRKETVLVTRCNSMVISEECDIATL